MWEAVSSPTEIEKLLLERNKRHLQQTCIEGGTSAEPPMSEFLEDNGLGQHSTSLLQGEYTTFWEVPEEVGAWMSHMKQTASEKRLPPVLGEITMEDFQQMFKVANEKTSSHLADLNYTIWKAMARSDYLSSFLCTLISLPFIYGFVNDTWTNLIDVMLEKKPGDCQIHCMRIIGLMSPAFNTALKFFIGKKT